VFQIQFARDRNAAPRTRSYLTAAMDGEEAVRH